MGSQVLPATITGIHDTYIGPVSRRINDEEGVRSAFDAYHYCLGGPLPTASAGSANMCDPVDGTIPIRLRYAGDLNVWHVVSPRGKRRPADVGVRPGNYTGWAKNLGVLNRESLAFELGAQRSDTHPVLAAMRPVSGTPIPDTRL